MLARDTASSGRWNSFAVREVVQSQMDIRAGPLAGISAPQIPQVSWRSFGVLESAPTVLGPLNSVPGNPGSPLVLTNPVDAVPFLPAKTVSTRTKQAR